MMLMTAGRAEVSQESALEKSSLWVAFTQLWRTGTAACKLGMYLAFAQNMEESKDKNDYI